MTSEQPPDAPYLEARHLRVDYGSLIALHDLSLTLRPGEIYGLVGPNGAGKTTLLSVLATLLEPTYGEVTLGGRDLLAQPRAVRPEIGLMPDFAPVTPELTVREFLLQFAGAYGWKGKAGSDRVDTCLEEVELTDKVNVFCKTLSRGMTQRVVLAKTLIPEPRLLLLDEPASGLDPLARRSLRETLERRRKQGATIILSSHVLADLEEISTRIGIMKKGRIVREGTVEEIAKAESAAATTTRVRIALLDRVEEAGTWLEAHPGVELLEVGRAGIRVAIEGEADDLVALLKTLVEAGFPVLSYTPETARLEDVVLGLEAEEGGAN